MIRRHTRWIFKQETRYYYCYPAAQTSLLHNGKAHTLLPNALEKWTMRFRCQTKEIVNKYFMSTTSENCKSGLVKLMLSLSVCQKEEIGRLLSKFPEVRMNTWINQQDFTQNMNYQQHVDQTKALPDTTCLQTGFEWAQRYGEEQSIRKIWEWVGITISYCYQER